MASIDKILERVESCITENRYETLETDKVELKDLSSDGSWKELYKSACAFLNSEGGMVIVGIKEHEQNKKTKYSFSGFNHTQGVEEKLKELPKQFTNQERQVLDLSIYFPYYEVKDFMTGKVCVIYIEKLPEDKKYVFYNQIAYKRKITGDHKLNDNEIEAQNELKIELENARELAFVPNSSINSLDVDKLNEYITRLNRDIRVESYKSDIASAMSFLTRKNFVRDNQPTLLGILVCGNRIEDSLGGRCQVDCVVNSPIQIAQNKQVLKDNILALAERSVGFIYKNIQVGVSHVRGGSDVPEYPEKLIRETINNALAHRDYSIDKFINIIIKPNESIEIRNPGNFRQEQKLILNDKEQNIKVRRIIPIPKARNPRLADILKTFDRWEGYGIGMASLTNACLSNQIAVPYYLFHANNDISLIIPKGKVLDDDMTMWLKSFSKYIFIKCNGKELTQEEQTVLCYFYQSERLNRLERYTVLLTSDNNHFEVITDLEEKGLIFKLESSPDIYPIYLVDRVLTKNDFTDELRAIYGGAYDALGNDYKETLQAIYLHNEFSNQQLASANAIGEYLYKRKNKLVTDTRDFDNFKRKIRNHFNRLEDNQLIKRNNAINRDFIINKNFVRRNSFFD